MDELDIELDDDSQLNAEEEEELLKSDASEDPENSKKSESMIVDHTNDENKNYHKDDDSDDSDSDDEEKEDQLRNEYKNTLAKIQSNKYDYNSYVQLVEYAHKLNDLNLIRESYQSFSKVYPLSPELWLRWLNIESSLATSQEEIEKVEQLFRKALDDYYCPNVALEYAKFAYKSTKCDEIWKNMLNVYALHCMRGREFFVLWRKYYEKRNDIPALTKLQNISKVYQQELQLPLYNMEESYIEFKVLHQKNQDIIQLNWDEIDKKYNIAKEQLKEMLPFEKRLTDLDAKFHQERAKLYREYIQATIAQKGFSKNITQILYERMVTECCLNETCWIDYANFIEIYDSQTEEDKPFSVPIFSLSSLDIIERALRNCPWSGKLHIQKLRLYEDYGFDQPQVQEVLESALECGFQEPEPYVQLWLEYLSYLRRVTYPFDDKSKVDNLRQNIEFAWNSLGKQWGVLADCDCEILQFWGKLEYECLRNPTQGQSLWHTVMDSSDNVKKSALWIEFAYLQQKHDIDATRRIFRKALSHHDVLDDPFAIVTAWKRFERCYGELKDYIKCEVQCEFVSQKLTENQKKHEQHQKDVSKKRKRTSGDDHNIKQPKEKSDQSTFKKPKVIKEDKNVSQHQEKKNVNVVKEHENDEIDFEKDRYRIFLSNLDYNITENEIIEAFPELTIDRVDLIKASNGRGRGFGYIQLFSENDVSRALEFDNRIIKGRPVYISSVLRDKEKRTKFKYSSGLEPKKLFIKGVPYDATVDELKEIFGKCGKIKEARMVYHKSGTPKGIAYIEYEDETSASMAVMKYDNYQLRDRTLKVAISAPPPKLQNEPPATVKKLLSVSKPKKTLQRTEQRPRMTLIPTSVQRLVAQTSKSPTKSTASMNGSQSQPSTSSGKSNEDFRKELLGKK